VQITPTIAVVGSFALLVVAAVIFIVVLTKSRRGIERDNGARHHLPVATHAASKRPLDTSLEGLDLSPSEDAPSAVLLAPLRPSEWNPPDTPAPADELPAASLAERIAGYEPAIDVPEPAFALDQHPEWQVAPESQASATTAERELRIPEVVLPEPVKPLPAEVAHVVSPPQQVDDFDAELAALLPRDELPSAIAAPVQPEGPPLAEPASAPEPGYQPDIASPPAAEPTAELEQPGETLGPLTGVEPEVATAAGLVPGTETAPVPVPEPAPGPELLPEAAPVQVIVPEPEPEPAQELVPVPEPAQVIVPEPVPEPELAQELVPAPAPPTDLTEDVFWSGLMAEQQGVPRPAAGFSAAAGAAATARPVVRVTTAEPPAPEPASEPRERRVHARPRATVRIHEIPVDAQLEGESSATLAPIPAGPRGDDIPDMVLETPVEMWFGDSRIGVKPGSVTYDKFKRYADALLADLNESASRADKV